MKNFKIGQRVVCQDPFGYLVQGEIYTVREMVHINGKTESLNVDECMPPQGFYGYKPDRFTELEYGVIISESQKRDLQDLMAEINCPATAINYNLLQSVITNLVNQLD